MRLQPFRAGLNAFALPGALSRLLNLMHFTHFQPTPEPRLLGRNLLLEGRLIRPVRE
jgi:hypothetical protein